MRFYLNTLANRVYVEVAPQITETFDESLDSATVVLQANTISIPYAPNQYFYICDDNNNILHTMILALDMVETYSSKPLRYRHTLTLTQNSRNLSKHTVRNSVFTQPMNVTKNGYSAFLNWLIKYDQTNYRWDYDANAWIEPINIYEKDVPYGDFSIKARIVGVKSNGTHPTLFYANFSDIFQDATTKIRIKLYESSTYTNVYYDLGSDELDQEIIIPAFYTYIKNNPTGNYSLRIDFQPFVNKAWDNSTISTATPTQFTLQLYYKMNVYNFNCYDLLELLIERQQLKNSTYGKQKLFTLPTRLQNEELYDLLVGTIPPNFTFTASTMYECIADIFKLFDAIFTLDNNNVLGIEYLNEYGTQNTDKESSLKSTHAEDSYNRGIINFYQDARVLERFPTGKGYAKARSSGLGVPTSTNDFCILLPHKIEYIDKVEMLNPYVAASFYFFQSGGTQTGFTDEIFHYEDDMVIDLGSFVYESSMWGLLSSGDLSTLTNNQEKIQANTTYYQKGDNKIMLGLTYQNGVIQTTKYNFDNILTYAFCRLLGIYNTNDAANTYDINADYYTTKFTDIKTAITYMASVDGKLEIESINPKYDGEIFVDQSNGAVDLNKLGLNMFGLAQKLGEPTLTKTMQITNFSNRIRKGQYIMVDGEKWIANVITHTILDGGKVHSVVNFVKNYNALSQFTRVDKEKRMSTISSDLVNKSEILFGEYLYFSTDSTTLPQAVDTKIVMSEMSKLFASTFKLDESDTHRVDYAIISSFDKNGVAYKFNDNGTETNVENVAIPLVRYGAGNSICLEASFSHPKSAGNKTVDNYNWWGGNAYFTNFVPYTDYNGFADKIDYKIYYKVAETNLDNYPIINTTNSDTLVIDLEKLVVDKFPNEILAINYQIHMLPTNSRKDIDFVGSAFINNNAVVKNPETKNFYIYVSNNYTYSVLDTKGQGTRYLLTNVTRQSNGNTFSLTFEYNTITNTGLTAWAICDENGNIYFASNTQPGTNGTIMYFNCRNQRAEDYGLEIYYTLQFTVGNDVTVVGNVGADFVSFPSGSVVTLTLDEGTPYSLSTRYQEHYYSDETGWETASGVVTSNINLGTSSNALQQNKFTINWSKNVIDVKVGDFTYTNPDPSDTFLYTTVVWANQGLEIDYEVTDVAEGYYVRNDSGTWDTDSDLTYSPVADAYRKITVNWTKKLASVRIGTISQGYQDYNNPNPSIDYGEQDIRTNIVQYAANTQFSCTAISGWQISSGDTGWSDWDDGDLYIDPTFQRQTFKLTASINSAGSAVGYILVTYTDPDTNVTTTDVRLDDGDYLTLKFGTNYSWTGHVTDSNASYIAGTDSGSGTMGAADKTIQLSVRPYTIINIATDSHVSNLTVYVGGTPYSYGANQSDTLKVGYNLVYSWSATADNYYFVSSGGSGGGSNYRTDGTTININVQTSPNSYNLTFDAPSGYPWGVALDTIYYQINGGTINSTQQQRTIQVQYGASVKWWASPKTNYDATPNSSNPETFSMPHGATTKTPTISYVPQYEPTISLSGSGRNITVTIWRNNEIITITNIQLYYTRVVENSVNVFNGSQTISSPPYYDFTKYVGGTFVQFEDGDYVLVTYTYAGHTYYKTASW